MPDRRNYVREAACSTDLAGGRCLGDDEILTHHSKDKSKFENGPRAYIAGEDEVSVIRGAVSLTFACSWRNHGNPVPPQDLARAGIRCARAGGLRDAGFAVVHTPGKKRDESGLHVSVIWPPEYPLDQRESAWPSEVRDAFASCFTEVEGVQT